MMLRHAETMTVFQEVPDEISLAINITGCPIRCDGCHSPHLWRDKGEILTNDELDRLIQSSPGITCVALMGGDGRIGEITSLARRIRETHRLKVCWYSGKDMPKEKDEDYMKLFGYIDYIKTGPYIRRLGGLDSPTTNQRMYWVTDRGITDITERFRQQDRQM